MGFDVHVSDMNSAAAKLGTTTSPPPPGQAAPNVGGTDGAGGYAADYSVWLETRKQDLAAADRQVDSLVAKIKDAARSYDRTDQDAREIYLSALDSGFAQIGR